MTFADGKGFHILLQHTVSVIRPHAIYIGWLIAKPRRRDFMVDWAGRRDRAFTLGLSRMKRDVRYGMPKRDIYEFNIVTT